MVCSAPLRHDLRLEIVLVIPLDAIINDHNVFEGNSGFDRSAAAVQGAVNLVAATNLSWAHPLSHNVPKFGTCRYLGIHTG